MKIFCIAIHDFISQKTSFTSPSYGVFPNKNIHETTIREYEKKIFIFLRDRPGMHYFKKDEDFYYAKVDEKGIVIAAVDQELSVLQQDELFKKLTDSEKLALIKIINNPNDTVKSKIEEVKELTEEARQEIFNTLETLLERNERIEVLVHKTDDLVLRSESFKKKSTQLKNSYRCPGLFFFLNPIKDFFWPEKYEYDYKPYKSANRKTFS